MFGNLRRMANCFALLLKYVHVCWGPGQIFLSSRRFPHRSGTIFHEFRHLAKNACISCTFVCFLHLFLACISFTCFVFLHKVLVFCWFSLGFGNVAKSKPQINKTSSWNRLSLDPVWELKIPESKNIKL